MGGGRDVFYSSFKNCLYGRRDRTFFIPALKTVYMGGGRDVFYSGFKICLYGRRKVSIKSLQSQHKIIPAKLD